MTDTVPLPPTDTIGTAVRAALAEDVGSGDRTAALIPVDDSAHAHVVTRDDAVLCGRAWFDEVFRQLDARVQIVGNANDGESIRAGQSVCRLEGPARAILTGERTGLNFLQTLSATATVTRRFVDAVRG